MTTSRSRILPNLLGRGLKYPLQFSTDGGISMVEGDALVIQSITEILLTSIGERPFVIRDGVPFGSRLPQWLFKSAEEVRDNAGFEVKRALSTWEPRIIVNHTEVSDVTQAGDRDPRYVRIDVKFRYRSDNRPDNWVRDFSTDTRIR